MADRARIESEALYRAAELLTGHGFHQAAAHVRTWSAEGLPEPAPKPERPARSLGWRQGWEDDFDQPEHQDP